MDSLFVIADSKEVETKKALMAGFARCSDFAARE
jgi:hypothetical protein